MSTRDSGLQKNGFLIVLSGPSGGAGKNSVMNAVFPTIPPNLKYSISVTTRPPRAGEVDAVNYFFSAVKKNLIA